MRVSIVAIVVLWLGSGSAFAQQPPNVQAAQNLFAKGNTAYNLGRFEAAADLFSKAYETWPQPDFLYNIAQSYRAGRNCKQALHFYKRFRSLKEQDTAAPLSQKKKDEIEKFISEATECIANADRSASAQPDAIVKPPMVTTTPTATAAPTITTPTVSTTPLVTMATTPSAAKEATATLALKDIRDKDDAVTKVHPRMEPKFVVARLTGGVALIGADGLDIPVQPVLGFFGGYPLHIAPVTFEVGAALSYTPLPYVVMNEQKRGMMLGARATAVASYPVMSKLSLRGEFGFGIVSLSGLEAGNPISSNHDPSSFTLPNIRLGLAAEYEFAPNIAAIVSPFSLALSLGANGMQANSLREIEMAIGIEYRQ